MVDPTIGFHTFTITKRVPDSVTDLLINDIEKYRDKTGEIIIYPDNYMNKIDSYGYYRIIEYPEQQKGLRWTIRTHNNSKERTNIPGTIQAKINPKLFAGIKDYLSAANVDCLNTVEKLFNTEAEKISPILSDFGSYKLSRCDYCLNIDVERVNLMCSPEQLMTLVKRAGTPTHYKEWTEYSITAHRQMPDQGSHYLTSGSVTINFYWKHKQLLSEYPDCPDLEASRNIVRFEIQYRYPKMYAVSKIMVNKKRRDAYELMNELLSDDYCTSVIENYINRTIRKGHYLTLEGARRMVEAHNFKPKKEQRLIAALEQVNRYRSISRAKEQLTGKPLDTFRRSLRELDEIRLNPVSIPREWGIKYIPNPLQAYYNSIRNDDVLPIAELLFRKFLKDYLFIEPVL